MKQEGGGETAGGFVQGGRLFMIHERMVYLYASGI